MTVNQKGTAGAQGAALLKAAIPRGALARLLALGFAGSLTEGLGLVLLLPILQVVNTGATGGGSGGASAGAGGGQMLAWYRMAGLPVRLDVLLGLFVLLVILRGLLVHARTMCEQNLQGGVLQTLRDRLFTALLSAGWRHSAQTPSATLTASLIGLTDRASMAAQFSLSLVAAGMTLATMLGAALLIAALPTLVLGLSGLLVLGAYAGLRRRARREGEALNASYSAYFTQVSERLAALRLIKAFGIEQAEAAAAQKTGRSLMASHNAYVGGIAAGQFALNSGAALALAVVVWLGFAQWHMDLARLLPLIALFARSVPLLGALQTGWQQLAHLAPALDDLAAMIGAAEAAAEPESNDREPLRLTREMRLDGVSLHHEGRDQPALDRVTLTIEARSTVLVTGPSGAGKSSLADLLAGLVLPTEGGLAIDGAPLSANRLGAWRRQVAYVQQEPVLFNASVRDNLAWAMPDAGEDRMIAALKAASAHFVLTLPDGLDTLVGERGARLSGGERQRLALARGLLREPDLLILDEVTSALDTANESAVTEVVARLKGRLTIIIIGHRGALSALADRTIQLDCGRIVPYRDTLRT